MSHPPIYFDRVRTAASQTWKQLIDNPELAGPWHQLFKQIQIPRHVVSELLQNADDAQATMARISIDNDTFVFSHNGRDFIEADFQSLCRFGHSNKRALHTIGFRGIGFKSTFSIGDRVELRSPTLSVAFLSDRFTEPQWMAGAEQAEGWTSVRVRIRDGYVGKELEKNLQEWIESPASLLFLRSVRNQTIGDREVRWMSQSAGPVDRSEWVSVSGEASRSYLHIRSGEEDFPAQALAEISQERTFGDSELSFPPCSVEIVLGMEGAMYVVLPTAVHTSLPFAVNAPFIQDPGRSKLKEPEISFTNRWLLERVGRLAAESLFTWVKRTDLSLADRCQGYGLVPETPPDDGTLESRCQAIVCEAFWQALDAQPFLLTERDDLVLSGEPASVPSSLLDVWDAGDVESTFLERDQVVLARHVPVADGERLERAGCIEVLDDTDVLRILEEKRPSRPTSLARILALWRLCAENLLSQKPHMRRTKASIVPALGSDSLHSADEVVRMGRRLADDLKTDWAFVAERLLPLDPAWIGLVAALSDQEETREIGADVRAIHDVLGLSRATDTSRIVNLVSQSLFCQENVALEDAIRIAQIAAKLDVTAYDRMRFVAASGAIQPIESSLVADLDGDLDLFAGRVWLANRSLHPAYSAAFTSCTEDDWKGWVRSGKSGLRPFVPMEQHVEEIYGRDRFENELRRRGEEGEIPENSYKRSEKYQIADWDFDETLWNHWSRKAEENPNFWGDLTKRILGQPSWCWADYLTATPKFVAKMGNGTREVDDIRVPARWILHLQGLPCLEDAYGQVHHPGELLLRNAETEALIDVEPFVRADLDTTETRPLLLALGVRQTATDAEGLLNRLRALALVEDAPVVEVQKWYSHLDRLTEKLSTEQMEKVRTAFLEERLILTADGGWEASDSIFLGEDEGNLVGMPVIHPVGRSLSLWPRLGVADRPSIEAAMAWLKGLPVGDRLSSSQCRTLRAVLSSTGKRAWMECGCWLNLEEEWSSVAELRFSMSEKLFAVEKILSVGIRRQTADFRFLAPALRESHPFCEVASLGEAIELRASDSHEIVGRPKEKLWLSALASGLQRIRFGDAQTQERVRCEAQRLADSEWWTVRGRLEIVPYLDATPVGTAMNVDAVWHGEEILVADLSPACLVTAVVKELSRPFDLADIRDAFRICYERSSGFVTEYLEESFDLESESPAPKQAEPTPKAISADAEHGLPPPPVDKSLEQQSPTEGPSALHSRTLESIAAAHHESEAPPDTQPRKSRIERPALMERFLQSRGFMMDGSPRRYVREDGAWVEKVDALWEEYDSLGELRQSFWAKDHCLDRDPLQLPAEVWEMCRREPAKYSLLLADADGNPVQLSGRQLMDWRDAGRLRIHNAEYRLVVTHEQ